MLALVCVQPQAINKLIAYFGLESDMVFEGTTGVYEQFVLSIPKE